MGLVGSDVRCARFLYARGCPIRLSFSRNIREIEGVQTNEEDCKKEQGEDGESKIE